VRGTLAREYLGERHLRGTADRGRRAVGADVQYVDDPAPAALLHLREDQPGEADLREQLEIEIGLPHLVGHFLGWAAGRLPGVVDQYVDLAELRHHLVIGPADVGQLGDVGADRGDLTLGPGLDLLLARGQSLGGAREDRDVRTGRGKPLRHRQAQPFAAAGDHGSASVQSNVHVRLPSPRLRAPSSDQPIDFLHLLGCQCPGRFRAAPSAGRL